MAKQEWALDVEIIGEVDLTKISKDLLDVFISALEETICAETTK